MQLQEIETLRDLKEWVEDNLKGATVYEDMYGALTIHLNLECGMGGELHAIGGDK